MNKIEYFHSSFKENLPKVMAHYSKLNEDDRFNCFYFGSIDFIESIIYGDKDSLNNETEEDEKIHIYYIAIKDEKNDFIGLLIFFITPLNSCEIIVSVLKEYRNKGFGTRLIEMAIEFAKILGINSINSFCKTDTGTINNILVSNGFTFNPKNEYGYQVAQKSLV